MPRAVRAVNRRAFEEIGLTKVGDEWSVDGMVVPLYQSGRMDVAKTANAESRIVRVVRKAEALGNVGALDIEEQRSARERLRQLAPPDVQRLAQRLGRAVTGCPPGGDATSDRVFRRSS